jgi:ADP-ribose pyrophosphatase
MSHHILRTILYHHARKFSYKVEELRLPNGARGEYAYIHHDGAAIAVPVTATGEFILVKQYRFPTHKYLLEFPAGTMDEGEQPYHTIDRELAEETGYRAHRWDYLGAFYICPGYSSEILHVYLARELEKLSVPPAPDSDEEIEVVSLSGSELKTMITARKGLLTIDAKSVTALYMAEAFLPTAP